MARTALVTGITGQDGAYLSRVLLDKGYRVFGAFRRGASLNLWRLNELGITEADLTLIPFELLEYANLRRAIAEAEPDEIYNLGAQSFVGTSFEQPLFTTDVNALGVTRMLEAIREVNPAIKFYQASTSEMFGKVQAALRMSRRRSTRAAPMPSLSCSRIGSRSTIASRTICSLVAEFCLITRAPCAASSS